MFRITLEPIELNRHDGIKPSVTVIVTDFYVTTGLPGKVDYSTTCLVRGYGQLPGLKLSYPSSLTKQ